MDGSRYLILVLSLFLSLYLILLLSVLLVLVMLVSVVSIVLLVLIIWILFWIRLDLSSFYIIIFRRLSMQLNIYTIFNRIDGSSDQLILARSDARVATDFVNSINSRNKELESKNYPLINLNDYELRKVGVFEDTTSVVTPVTPVVVPFA